MIGSLFASVLSLALASAAPEPPTLIFLLGGQSNMVGMGEVPLLPKAYKPMPASVSVWEEGEWKPMTAQGDRFGPEFSFAHDLAAALPKERIGIIKHAKDGSPIAEWSPDDPQSLYAGLMSRHRAAREAAPGARTVAMLWMQGERDARFADAAAIYGRKLQEFVAAVRRDVGEENLAFLCGHVNPSSRTHTFVNAVRAAQADLPKRVRRFVLVSTNGLHKRDDNLHYDAKAQVELGKRYAKAYLNLEKSGDKQLGKDEGGSTPSDPFARGAVWSGQRAFGLEGARPEEWRLTITERDGLKFKGEALMLRGQGNDATYKVEGTAPTKDEGPVDFLTEKKGLFQQHYRGTLADGEVFLSFDGTAFKDGSKATGTATLRPRD